MKRTNSFVVIIHSHLIVKSKSAVGASRFLHAPRHDRLVGEASYLHSSRWRHTLKLSGRMLLVVLFGRQYYMYYYVVLRSYAVVL